MITLDNIGFEFSGRWLYRNTTLQFSPGDRIGLIGRNGTGKTTLLRLITGEYTPVEGKISMAKGMRIGFLKQEMEAYKSDKSIMDVALEAFEDTLAMQEEEQQILESLQSNPSDALIKRLTELQQELEVREAYNIENQTKGILAGLGFKESDMEQPFNTFSGGWRMRVLLAKLLLARPGLLLLDEPTNHLDLPSIEWLESYLENFSGAFIIVSHDQYFLDRLTNATLELAHQRFTFYKGNYTFYLKEKKQREELHERQYENQQKMIAETERFINRFRAKATKARQVQSKIKMLEKLDRISAPEKEAATVSFQFKPEVNPGKQILNLDIDSKAYGPKQVLQESKLTIMRGDKIALIGANGTGKSTALRVIAGSEPFEGERKLGVNVQPGFFAQHQLEALTPKNDIMEEMRGFVYDKGEAYVRGVLGGFLFTGDDVFKKVAVLSGGEKSRVALAKTLLAGTNFLLLDEPTNHLDIQSIHILTEALNNYEGTYVVVSHDRYFLRNIANKIWYIQDRVLKEFPGTYEEFQYHLGQKAGKEGGNGKQSKSRNAVQGQQNGKAGGSTSGGQKPKSDYHQEKERKKKRRRLENGVEKAETRIMELEEKKEGLMAEMALPENSREFEKLKTLQDEVNTLEQELQEKTTEWESLLEELEALENE